MKSDQKMTPVRVAVYLQAAQDARHGMRRVCMH